MATDFKLSNEFFLLAAFIGTLLFMPICIAIPPLLVCLKQDLSADTFKRTWFILYTIPFF